VAVSVVTASLMLHIASWSPCW